MQDKTSERSHISHEQQYNTRHGLPLIPDEIRRKVRRQPRKPQIQQKPLLHLLLETTLGRDCSIPRLPVQTPSQPSKSAYRGGTEAHPGYAPPKPGSRDDRVMASTESYTRCPKSLFRVMRKMGLFPQEKPQKAYTPKPYEQMTHPGERIQVDVKVVPRKCIADPELRLFQYTAIVPRGNGGRAAAVHRPPGRRDRRPVRL